MDYTSYLVGLGIYPGIYTNLLISTPNTNSISDIKAQSPSLVSVCTPGGIKPAAFHSQPFLRLSLRERAH